MHCSALVLARCRTPSAFSGFSSNKLVLNHMMRLKLRNHGGILNITVAGKPYFWGKNMQKP